MVLVNNISKKEYVAAVVEYSPIIYNSPRKTILENVEQYETIINNASHYVSKTIDFSFPHYAKYQLLKFCG